EAGPEFGFLVSSKAKGSGVTVDVKDEMNSFDFGVGLGAGYYFTPNFGLTARYVAGFTDVVKDNPDDAVKNNVFQVGLAYKFAK
ncbi:MAG: outer membrane beta-barrel protein, partial [Kaistella sp.]